MLEFWQSSPVIVGLGIALTLAAHLAFRAWAPYVTNFQGRRVRTGYGLYVSAWALAPAAVAALIGDGPAFVIIILAFAVPGFLDDLFGAHGAGGIGGHVKALLKGRRVTTGLIKALVGGAGSLAGVALFDHRWSGLFWPHTVAGAAVVALMANFINLLDLRPGRAGSVALLLWAASMAASQLEALFFLTGPAFLCELVLLPSDSRGRWIMGDSGSNVLGALIGVVIVSGLPAWTRWAALAVLIAVHLYAERRSISRTIESVPLLRWIDARLGVR